MRILEVSASGRRGESVSRKLSSEIIDALEMREGSIEVVRRDLSDGIPLVDERWIQANFTPEEQRTRDQREALADSDALVEELQAADVALPAPGFEVCRHHRRRCHRRRPAEQPRRRVDRRRAHSHRRTDSHIAADDRSRLIEPRREI